MSEVRKLLLMLAVLAAAALVPFGDPAVSGAVLEALLLLREYAREHVLLCLVPAFFIAGGIGALLSSGSVLRYLGARARPVVSYAVASVAGSVLAVCSCTVLPLFAGIYRRGAGLGPACAFLYAGPAVNVLAIVLTARVLGWELGVARAVGAVVFSVVVGLVMAVVFRREEAARVEAEDPFEAGGAAERPLWKTAVFFAAMVALLVLAAWGRPREPVGWAMAIWRIHGYAAAGLLVVVLVLTFRWFSADERRDWVEQTWGLAQQILPLLLIGVVAAGLLLGRPGSDAGLIPSSWITDLVGEGVHPVLACLVASVSGALMYVATLTEIPILEGLMGQGMGQGPALSLLLAGPAVSLPNLLVVRGVLGTRRTLVYAILVVLLATVSGFIFGWLVS